MEKGDSVEYSKINHILLDESKYGVVVDCDGTRLKLRLSDFDDETIKKFVDKMVMQGTEIGGDTLNDFMKKYELYKISDYMRNNEPDLYKLVMMIGDKIKENGK